LRVITDNLKYPGQSPPSITVHALKENKRPIGFAPWPEEKKKRKKRKPVAKRGGHQPSASGSPPTKPPPKPRTVGGTLTTHSNKV